MIGIRCGHLISMKGGRAEVERDVFIGIEGSKIARVEKWQSSHGATKLYDLSKHVVIPGLVNAHTHLAMTLFRGFEDDLPFHKWLFDRILPLERDIVRADFVRAGTELAALESIRFGVTTVFDMYFYVEEVLSVLDRAGLRGVVAQPYSQLPLPENKDVGADKGAIVKKLLSKYANHERLKPCLGPHAPYTCDDTRLKEVAALQKETGALVHIHVAETKKEVEDSLKEFGKTPVKRLYDLGVLTPKTVCAHMVHVNETDMDVLEKSGASVVYNPDSNMKLGSGTAPIAAYLKRGIPVAFGTDGAASSNSLNLIGAMNLGTKLQKLAAMDNTAMTAHQALEVATMGGAKALGMEKEIGSIEVGKRADIVALEVEHPHMQPTNDLASHLVYSATGLEVSHVFCHGKILLNDGKHTTLDKNAIYSEAEKWRAKIYEAKF